MRLLLDECLPRKKKVELAGHQVNTVPEMGWAGTKNGTLLRLAETTFDVFITIDHYVPFQHNLTKTRLMIVVFVAPDNRLETLRERVPELLAVLPRLQLGEIAYIGS
jgi:hypothetical protein